MKNILVIVPSLKFGGGAERASSVIGTKLFDKGYYIRFFTFYDQNDKYEYKGKYYTLNEKTTSNIVYKFIKLFSRAFKIARICKQNKIETIISFMEDANFPSIISGIFGNKAKINIAIRHSLFEYGKGLYYRLIKLLYKYSNKIITMTEYEKNNLINNFNINPDKVIIIHNSLDIEKIDNNKNELISEYKNIFENEKFTFVTVGRLNKIKNQELLIKAFHKLNNEHNESQLIILGDGELKERLLTLITDLKNTNIHLLGNQKNIFKFLNKSDCFVLSSHSEAFPNVIIEAMACGLPIISTDTQGSQEILSKNEFGIITKNNDIDSLYSAMKTILENENTKNILKEKSLKRINDFKIENIIKKWEDIL